MTSVPWLPNLGVPMSRSAAITAVLFYEYSRRIRAYRHSLLHHILAEEGDASLGVVSWPWQVPARSPQKLLAVLALSNRSAAVIKDSQAESMWDDVESCPPHLLRTRTCDEMWELGLAAATSRVRAESLGAVSTWGQHWNGKHRRKIEGCLIYPTN